MRRTFIILVCCLFALALHSLIVDASTLPLPGGWQITLRYCRNGYTASDVVVGNLASASATNNLVVNSITPSATGLGPMVILNGSTIVSGPAVFYWATVHTPGTPVSASVSRIENGVVVGSITDNGSIEDCNVPAQPPAPTTSADNRINLDPVAPVAIYCRPDGIEILSIDGQGNGHAALFVRDTQINALGVPATNTLIAAGGGVGLFRLSTGEFQVNFPTNIIGATTTTQQPLAQGTTSSGGNIVHVVQRGENLFRISLRYHLPMSVIASANGITNYDLIYAGQRLIIPAGGTRTGVTPAQPIPIAAGGQRVVAGQDYVFIWNGC